MAARKLIFNLEILNVGLVDVAVPRPIGMWAVLKRFEVLNENALLTVPALSLVDIPAPILKTIEWNRPFTPGSNLDFLVKLSSGGPETINGFIVGFVYP